MAAEQKGGNCPPCPPPPQILHCICVFVYSYVKEKDVMQFKVQVESSQMRGGKDQGSSYSRTHPRRICENDHGKRELSWRSLGSLSTESSLPISGIHTCLYTLWPLTRLFFEKYNRSPAIDITLIMLWLALRNNFLCLLNGNITTHLVITLSFVEGEVFFAICHGV